jgi:hypothetical protein
LGIEAPSFSAWRWLPAIPRLGREPDARIAADLGLSVTRVEDKRRELGIPPPPGRQRVWKDEEIALLGTAPDPVIGRRLGRSPGSVYLKREKLGIPRVGAPRRSGRRRAKPEEDAASLEHARRRAQ